MISQKTTKKNHAFSLVELSIVILVIGILVAAITKGKDLYEDIKLTAARSVTTSSPVSSIKGMVLWLETTMDKSFNSGSDNKSDITFDESGNLTTWNDVNPSSSVKIKYTASGNPTVVRSGIAGLPAVEFDGVGDYLQSLSEVLPVGDQEYTVAIVWMAENLGTVNNYLWEQSSAARADNEYASFIAATGSGSQFDFKFATTAQATTLSNGSNAPVKRPISAIVVNNITDAKLIGYLNGVATTTTPPVGQLIGANISRIGANAAATAAGFYTGLISEIIVFDKALKETDVREIEDYFSQKYSIKMAN